MKKVESGDDLKKYLDLYLKGRLSARQKVLLERQLDEFKKEDTAPFEFNQQNSEELWKKISAETIDKQPNRKWLWMPVAAALVIMALGGAIFMWINTNTGVSNKIILGDGSIVWLKNGALLDYSNFTTNDRQVTLTGEALFEVTRMTEHPFVIHCGNYEARVLGTSFNIKSDDNSVELTVLTGTVKLSSLKKDQSIIVNANEHIVFNEIVAKSKSTPDELQHLTKDTQYNMLLEDTRMSDVLKKVEQKFDVHIKLNNKDISNCMISADFTDQSLPVTLEMISEALGFQYEIHGNEVIISGSGCIE